MILINIIDSPTIPKERNILSDFNWPRSKSGVRIAKRKYTEMVFRSY